LAKLELIWRNGSAYALGEGPARITVLDDEVDARELTVAELIELADSPPADIGDSARGLFALVALARRSVSEGMVHPQLSRGGDSWYAFWGATLDEEITAYLSEIADALPFVSSEGFHDDPESAVHDLYPRLADEIARSRLGAVRYSTFGRRTAADAVLDTLVSPDPELPPSTSYAGLERRLTRWVDDGLATLKEATWQLELHLEERPGKRLLVERWLAADNISFPVSILDEGGEDGVLFIRDSDPAADLERELEHLGLELPMEVDATQFLTEVMPTLDRRVLLPAEWLRTPTRLRANVDAFAPSSGLLSTSALASFDWRLAVGDTELSDEELRALAESQAPVVQVDGEWRAVRPADVKRALRFLERRNSGVGFVDLVRAVSGLATDEYGLELGHVRLDKTLDELLSGKDARFRPRPTPAGMAHQLFAFQEKGHGWLRMLGDLGIGAILADDMGLGKTVQAIAMLVSEREEVDGLGPTLVVCPMSVARQWVKEVERFAPGLRVHLHHGSDRLANEDLIRHVGKVDVVVTSYDIAVRDIDVLAEIEWDRLIMDEAQDVKNPQTKRARSLRAIQARRRVAMTGTPIENRLNELWAIMDILNPGLLGSREWFARTFAQPIEVEKDEAALERLRAVVQPFILRRSKDEPEVELDLPPITVEKDYCKLTIEQASLYQATVDRWFPRIESHEDRFGRRGAVLAMLNHLKQVCNHPEMLMHTGAPLEGRSGKLERLVELMRGLPADDKALVFTQYPSFDRLVTHLEERLGRKVGFFHGRLNARQRDELLTAFAGEGGPSVLVISIRAGGRGLNLPAANHVFHFDRWWNPAVEQQATDRAHRLGQHKPVYVHSLICTGTLEERIDALLESKRELVDKVMAGKSDDWLGDLDLGAIRAAVSLAPDAMEAAA